MFKEPWKGTLLMTSALIYGAVVPRLGLPWYVIAPLGLVFGFAWAGYYLHRENGT